jgi:hypothetical protein
VNLKGARPSPAVPIMACNILLCAFQDEQVWPENFIKVCQLSSRGFTMDLFPNEQNFDPDKSK